MDCSHHNLKDTRQHSILVSASETNKEGHPAFVPCSHQRAGWGNRDRNLVWARTMGFHWWMTADLVPRRCSTVPRTLCPKCPLLTSLCHSKNNRWHTPHAIMCLNWFRLHLIFITTLCGCVLSLILYLKKWSQKELQKLTQGYRPHMWKKSCSHWGKLVPLLHCGVMHHAEMFLQN